MRELRNIQLIILTMLITVLAWLGWWLMNGFFSNQLFNHYAVIPVSFYIFGLVLILVLNKAQKLKPQRIAQVYLLMHVIKFVLFGGLALFFVLALGIKSKLFLIVFAAYYFVFIAFETLAIYSIEKRLRKQRDEQTTTI